MTCHISCYNNKTRELEHFVVPEPVFVYIRQLECEINYGRGGVQKLYPFRFGGKFDVEDLKVEQVADEKWKEFQESFGKEGNEY